MVKIAPIYGRNAVEQRLVLISKMIELLCKAPRSAAVIFDIDNTIIHGNGKGRVVEDLITFVVHCVLRGHPVHFVTARPEKYRRETVRDLRRWFRHRLAPEHVDEIAGPQRLWMSASDDPHADKRKNHEAVLKKQAGGRAARGRRALGRAHVLVVEAVARRASRAGGRAQPWRLPASRRQAQNHGLRRVGTLSVQVNTRDAPPVLAPQVRRRRPRRARALPDRRRVGRGAPPARPRACASCARGTSSW